ncbi:sugar phosphate nucleotidyltransferase [Cohnella hashimotonis]|uniref:Sugar phosphate nucleotidyltransferase n=1 Tax=Cohnella hashimotonis TaxID=2826895 RepID=A0ABT6TVT0_9BACL|nr:sugar phosphate nucleotidyltransferase [Cohnella hashimotonis]MDI4650333.1 sugar phosphate nucleotidyltransferase [Cohnella hashimotonis]
MKLILLSGGSGKRLWPLSNDARSKQFLRVIENNEGQLESMVERVWNQLENHKLSDSTVIATSKAQVEMIHSQLGSQVSLVIEPERRDTFPAIALAASYLMSMAQASMDEVVIVLPVDPFVDNNFFDRIIDLETTLKKSEADLALIGVKPTYPSEKYGYIVPEQSSRTDYLDVSHFKEKPTEIEAIELIVQNALWNCGVFAFKLEYLISLLHDKGLPVQYDALLNNYNLLEKTSFDYAVVEKAKRIVAIAYEGDWKDLGTWNTLVETMSRNIIGKGILSEDSTNTHIVNELDIPVTVLGVKDAVIAVSSDGILVSEKSASPRLKETLKGYEQPPMYEERRWGWFRVLDYTKFEDEDEVLTKRVCVKSGRNLSYHKHYIRSEVWTIISGHGEFVINDEIKTVKSGDVLRIPKETKHAIKAISDLEFIEVQTGNQLFESDIERIFFTWEEITGLM